MWQGLGQKYAGTERTWGRGSSQRSVVKRQVRQDSTGGKNRNVNARWKRYCSAKAEKTEHNMPEREQKCQGVTGPAPQMKPCEVPHSSKQVLLGF